MKKSIILLLTSISIFSCSKDDLPDFNKIESPRIIAIIANKPEANPGDMITITPVISDLKATTGVSDSIQVCVDLGIAFGASVSCEGNPTKTVVRSLHLLNDPGITDNWTGAADPATFTLPNDAIIFNQRSDQDKYNGVNYIIEYTLHSPSGVNIKAIKRIAVTEVTKTNKNLNPLFTDIFANNVSMVNLPVGGMVNLTNDLTNASAENYSIKDAQGNLKNYTEELTVTWFITDGETKFYRSLVGGTNEYTGPGSAPAGRSAYIFAVARDDRGGVVVIKKKLN